MPFAEDLSLFFNADEFASLVSIAQQDGGTVISVSGIWDDGYRESVLGMAGMSTSDPRFTCATVDVDGVEVEDTLTKDGTQYVVAEIQPDGTGITTLMLRLRAAF